MSASAIADILTAPHMSAFGGKADMTFALGMSAYDPKRTLIADATRSFGGVGPWSNSKHCDELRRVVGYAADEITKLDQLKKSGSITEDEFRRLRTNLIQ
jgi:hypothetical protein